MTQCNANRCSTYREALQPTHFCSKTPTYRQGEIPCNMMKSNPNMWVPLILQHAPCQRLSDIILPVPSPGWPAVHSMSMIAIPELCCRMRLLPSEHGAQLARCMSSNAWPSMIRPTRLAHGSRTIAACKQMHATDDIARAGMSSSCTTADLRNLCIHAFCATANRTRAR